VASFGGVLLCVKLTAISIVADAQQDSANSAACLTNCTDWTTTGKNQRKRLLSGSRFDLVHQAESALFSK